MASALVLLLPEANFEPQAFWVELKDMADEYKSGAWLAIKKISCCKASVKQTVNMSDKDVDPEVDYADDTDVKTVSRFTRWYRSPLFNVIVVGMISFTQPGIWNALNSK